MQRRKVIDVAGRKVTVSEISVARIYRMLRGDDAIINLPLPEAFDKVKGLLPLAVDVDLEELLASDDLFYDDLTGLYEAFKSTNPIFFETARMLNLDSVLASILKRVVESFSSRFAGFQNMGTGLPHGTMDTDFSSM